MANTSGKILTVAVAEGWMFELDANGYPDAPSTTAYEGLQLQGIKAVDLNIPEPRRISHNDATRVLAVDFLPSLEPITGEVRVATLDMEMASKLGATKTFVVGEKTGMVWGTDKQGKEIDCGLFVVQQGLDRSTKLRRYRNVSIPKARAIPLASGMNDAPSEQRFSVSANPSSKHLWGTSLANATEGATEAAFSEFMSEGVGKIIAFKGDGVEDVFDFPTNYPSMGSAKVAIWVNGVLKTLTTDYTLTSTSITFVSVPAADAKIVVFYEYDPSA